MQTEINYSQLSLKLNSVKGAVFVVSGKSFSKTGFLDNLQINNSVELKRFTEFSENPTLEEVIAGLKAHKKSNASLILAVGGGTAMDLAKLIKCYANIPLTGEELTPPDVTTGNDYIDLITVPTTFGTGSESTHFAVMYINENKFSVAHQSMLPDFFLLDSNLSNSLPIKVKTSSCLDALCQAIESFWSVSGSNESRLNAIEAIRLIRIHFIDYITGKNGNSNKAIAHAANLAGKAINISKTTAPHAISYTLTSKFNVPHGHAVALCIRNMFELNYSRAKPGSTLQQRMLTIFSVLQVKDSIAAKKLINTFMETGGLETSLINLGLVNDETINLVVDSVNTERLSNHPVPLSKLDIKSVLTYE